MSSGIRKDKRLGRWVVDRVVLGVRLHRTFEAKGEAERWLSFRSEAIRNEALYGIRPPMTFEEAATRRLSEIVDMPSAKTTAYLLNSVMRFVGTLDISKICDQSFDEYRRVRASHGMKAKTIKLELQAAKAVLNDAENKWKTQNNISFLSRAPRITYPSLLGKQRPPHPLSWGEQTRLLAALPDHLKSMAEFGINTGARDSVICNLRWAWKTHIPEIDSYVFMVPDRFVKGRKQGRALILNSVAKKIVEAQVGRHAEYVFVFRRERIKNTDLAPTMPFRPVTAMLNTAWVRARKGAGIPDLHVHDLRHTFATRLRDCDVDQQSIRDLLWHANITVTDGYASAPIHRT